MNAHGKTSLTKILSALDGVERRPANANEARRHIGKRCAALGLNVEPVLEAAPSLLRGDETPADWLARLQAEAHAAPAIDDEVTFEDTGENHANEIGFTEEPVANVEELDIAEREMAAERTNTAPAAPKPPREGSKMAVLIALLQRPEGADLDQMVAATGWLKHTTRAVLSRDLAKRFGRKTTSSREDGRRVYRLDPTA